MRDSIVFTRRNDAVSLAQHSRNLVNDGIGVQRIGEFDGDRGQVVAVKQAFGGRGDRYKHDAVEARASRAGTARNKYAFDLERHIAVYADL